MVKTGLDKFPDSVLPLLKNRKVAVLCHAPSINRSYSHILDIIRESGSARLSAIFGPQHGLFGQTQDNMIEWEGYPDPKYHVPVYSLYGNTRKPTDTMMEGTEVFLVDLQDVGSRPYTYVWTLKNCMEVCAEKSIPLVLIDRPNPLGGKKRDGAVLSRNYFTFVGGACVPLCHGMTMGELALWVNDKENIHCDLHIIRMEGWQREMTWEQTGLPWVLPSPNMPTINTAKVYPGMVLTEALNISEGRGTTMPFELCGATFLDADALIAGLKRLKPPGCSFRQHNFIPVFHKFANEYVHGIQIHITDYEVFEPVYTAACIFKMINELTGKLSFNDPPYEYEEELMPFDILSGDNMLRKAIAGDASLNLERERWREEIHSFEKELNEYALY